MLKHPVMRGAVGGSIIPNPLFFPQLIPNPLYFLALIPNPLFFIQLIPNPLFFIQLIPYIFPHLSLSPYSFPNYPHQSLANHSIICTHIAYIPHMQHVVGLFRVIMSKTNNTGTRVDFAHRFCIRGVHRILTGV